MNYDTRYLPEKPHAIDAFDQFDLVDTPIRVLARNADGIIFYVGMNKVGYSASRLDPGNVVGRALIEVYPGEGGILALYHQEVVFESGKHGSFYIPSQRKVGVLQRADMVPVFDENGTVIRVVESLVDVPLEREAMEQRVSLESKMLELESYISLAAHDLRAPMRQVESLAKIIKAEMGELTDQPSRYVTLLEELAVQTQELIVEVLTRASTSINSAEVPCSEFVLEALCRSLCSVLDPFGKNEVSIEPCTLVADRVAFQVILGNLIDNSIKHSQQENIKLRISVSEAEKDGFLEVSVEDDGVGIEHPETIFVESSKGREHKHFGLFGVRQMILSQGGDIALLCPSSGRGLLVKFTFPGRVCFP